MELKRTRSRPSRCVNGKSDVRNPINFANDLHFNAFRRREIVKLNTPTWANVRAVEEEQKKTETPEGRCAKIGFFRSRGVSRTRSWHIAFRAASTP